VPSRRGRVTDDRSRGELDGVVACRYVVERLAVVGAAPDPVEGGVDEAELSACALVGEGDDGGPERSRDAGAAADGDVVSAALEGDRDAGSIVGLGSDVGYASGGCGAVDSGLVREAGEEPAEPAATCTGSAGRGGCVPPGLADVRARAPVGTQSRAADGERE